MRKITHQQGQQIIDAACTDWKETLFAQWGKQVVLKQDIEITEEFYKVMRKACTISQNELFDEVFGPYGKFEIGEWVTWTGQTPLTAKIIRKDTTHRDCWVINEKTHNYCHERYLRVATKEEILKARTPVAGKWYRLEYTGQYCHWYNSKGEIEGGREKIKDYKFQFVGMVYSSPNNPRAIFFSPTEGTSYLMMGERFDYIVEEITVE